MLDEERYLQATECPEEAAEILSSSSMVDRREGKVKVCKQKEY
jgi:hypothetical protein